MAENFLRITPVIIVKNGAPYLERTLEVLAPFRQVVLYDNGSTDGTPDLAQRFPNVKLVRGSFIGFGPTKNAAAACAQTDWVLSLDIDERPTPELLAMLADWSLDDGNRVGEVLRDNYFCGRHIRTNGWGNDWLCRLYHRGHHAFTDSAVHEKLQLNERSRVVRLRGSLEHEAITDLAQMLNKAQHYSELYAQSDKARLYPFPVILLKACFGFVRSYLFKAGTLSGARGFMIAAGEAMGVYFKYAKVYQRRVLGQGAGRAPSGSDKAGNNKKTSS